MFSERKRYFETGPDESMVDKTREKIAGLVNESQMPTEDYESTVGIFGGRLKYDQDGKLVFNMKGFVSKADRFGDAVLRTYDEHTMRQPLEILKQHPKWFFAFIKAGTKRFRGSPEQIAEHVKELGLDEYYGLHPDGIEIKNPEVFTKGIALQDIYRADLIDSENLDKIDRFQALASASQYVKQVHENGGGIGELLSNDIIFQQASDKGKAENPILNIPDIVYNKDLKKKVKGHEQSDETKARDQKATDMLDFMFHIGVEELRRSEEDWKQVEKSFKTILENYDDKEVIEWIKSFATKGRLTLVGDKDVLGERKRGDTMAQKTDKLLSQHNKARLSTQTELEGKLRKLIIDVCGDYIEKRQQ